MSEQACPKRYSEENEEEEGEDSRLLTPGENSGVVAVETGLGGGRMHLNFNQITGIYIC